MTDAPPSPQPKRPRRPRKLTPPIELPSSLPATSPEGALEFMWRAFSNLNEWVRFSDAKAAAVLAANGVLVGGIATMLAGSKPAVMHAPLAILWLAILIISSFYSSAHALLSLRPRLKAPRKSTDGDTVTAEETSSLVFFMDIDKHFPRQRSSTARLTPP